MFNNHIKSQLSGSETEIIVREIWTVLDLEIEQNPFKFEGFMSDFLQNASMEKLTSWVINI